MRGKLLVLLFIILLSAPAFGQTPSIIKAYKILRTSGKITEESAPKFLICLKGYNFSKLSKLLLILPREERAQAIISLAIEKKLISDIDALQAMRSLKQFEMRAIYLSSEGATDNISKLDDYYALLLNKIANNKTLDSSTILTQVQQLKNGGLAGTRHKITNILFDDQGYPIFLSVYDVKLPQSMYKVNDYEQFKYATNKLSQEIKSNQQIKKYFSLEAQEKILAGYKPSGFTWHHSQKDGVLQLVDTKIHQQTSHTGGRALWGGGKECR